MGFGRLWDAFEKLLEAMKIPKKVLSNNEELLQEVPQLKEGFHFILPSFFEMIKVLIESKRDFAIVFRTFGPVARD